ncbi:MULTISPECIES: type II secretion system F family protein [unclassified Candidatus Frackibacter]|uniref:type II secretion system F family protein n=1 Tax=unclassified Candidatus Frackibacter TaxID=2648818 RepID=UPI000797EB54|nr:MULTISPECIES: type II secretion system F family protein [unclassified Candidatus Frackibacter]KXS42642.1 MAG: tight adherence protein B [Candidatus Frackibacter sp. T328-2]SDC72301.1 tight adherence protein B [Candidatus Frackibacter sp. WG11]SEM86588.1 tight adherence protein B [Candidatus Frackibacter sp. WG12]SFL95644.1 tight adherence protein B [Candidatus Frackibacter sp. WG13]
MVIAVIILVFLTVTLGTLALYSLLTAKQERLNNRLNKYLETEEYIINEAKDAKEESVDGQKRVLDYLSGFSKVFASFSLTSGLEDELKKTSLPIKASEFITLNLIIISVLGIGGLLILKSLIHVVLLAVIGAIGPYLYLRYSQKKRLNKFNDQIADSLTIISNSLKAGYSFFQALEMVAKEMAPPISEEFTRVLKEVNLGAPAEEALVALTERVESDDLDLVITAVVIQRQVGGNLSEILDSISHTIRERIKIQGEIKTLTAQGKVSGIIIGILPVGLGLVLGLINPGYMLPLLTHPLGKTMIGIALISQLIGLLFIKKIISIKV